MNAAAGIEISSDSQMLTDDASQAAIHSTMNGISVKVISSTLRT